jgi:hypothetical protein
METRTAADLFAPHIVLPVQFYASSAMQPEKRLMLALLGDALHVYAKGAMFRARGHRRLFAETEEWLFSEETSWPFSCVNICRALDIDITWLRAQLGRRPETVATRVVIGSTQDDGLAVAS